MRVDKKLGICLAPFSLGLSGTWELYAIATRRFTRFRIWQISLVLPCSSSSRQRAWMNHEP